ncbi:MAG: carotenoid oxygenase family protein [Acidimicrobiales bacterium]
MSTTEADLTTTVDGTPLPWHLQGNYGPVELEVDADDLEVEGVIPAGLDGTYLRNGFNPRTGWSDHWFFGHGMVHRVDIAEGKASYRNRYVRTRFYERGSAQLSLDPLDSPANTHVLAHAGRVFALEEAHLPYEITPDLETVGVADFGGAVTGAFTAHPKICPVTGEMLAFGYNPVGPEYLRYYRFSADGELVQSEPITLPAGVMMHDFNITEHHVVWMDLPVVFDLAKAMEGQTPFNWTPENGARLGVMPRDGGDADVRWFDIDPCYVFHPVNSHEEGDRIILTVCRADRAMAAGFDDISAKASLYRWTIDLAAGTVTEELLDERKSDFARVDDRLVGLPARYGYTMALGDNPDNPEMGHEVYKYDLVTGVPEIHHMGAVRGGEPVFVPRTPDAGEDDGWVLLFAYDPEADRGELRIIDARNFGGPPVARVFTPQRVPYGAHGSWLPRG